MKLRMIAAVAATTLIATLGLTACSGDSASADCVKVSSGSASDSVKVEGEFGGSTTVTVDSAVNAKSLERTVVTKGDGEVPKTGQSVDAMVSIFSGADGKRIDAVSTTLTANDNTLADPARAGLTASPSAPAACRCSRRPTSTRPTRSHRWAWPKVTRSSCD